MLRQKPDTWIGSHARSLVAPEAEYTPEDFSIIVTGLPPCGMIVRSDGLVPVALGDALTARELGGLTFVPALDDSRTAAAKLVYVPQSRQRLPLSLAVDIAADAAVIIAEVPTNGHVFLADGMAPLCCGQTISAAQLYGLTFRPADGTVGQISLLRYRSADEALAGDVLVLVGPEVAYPAMEQANADARDDNGWISPLAAALLLEAGLSSLKAVPASAAVDPGEVLHSNSSTGSNAKVGTQPLAFGNKVALVTDKIEPGHNAIAGATTLAQSPATGTTGATTPPPDQPRHHHIGSSTPPDFGDLKLAPLSSTLTAPKIPSPPAISTPPATATLAANSMTPQNAGFLAPAGMTSGTTHWTNSSGGSWNSAANWSGGIPGPGSDVLLDAGGSYLVASTANVDINSLVVDAGATLIGASGTSFIVEGSVLNNGMIEAGPFGGGQNSTIDIKGNVAGTGSFEIANQAVLEIQGSVSGQLSNGSFSGTTVSFATGNGELILDNSAQFHGLITNSPQGTQLAPADLIDLKDLAFTSSMSTSVNYDMASNISTVNFGNGSNTITLQFSGKDPTWNFSSDGQGGTIISDPASSNPIALENALPGTPQSVWQISPGQDSTKLQGFTTAISTNIGSTVQFKIDNLTGNPNYQIQIYRLGYYGGNGARLVTTLQHQGSSVIAQPTAITNPATGEVDAGNWSVTDSWNIPSAAVSGVYVANVVEGSQVFQIPFIVKNPSSSSDIVFQTDDETWQAYNGWGGTNLYGGNGPSAGGPQGGAGAAYAVSYNRPITTYDSSGVESGPQDTVWGAEYSAIYWLEQNGYDVSYISGMDAATNGSLLLNHKIYMDVGHDEYWTDSQVANVQAAANAGVNLAFMSGNEIFWQTQFTPSIDGSNTANRTLVTYKDSHFQKLVNPSGQGTGAFAAPTSWGGAGAPSNALTGTVFTVDQVPTLGAITIPYGQTQLRVWRNTSVANTAPGQTATLSSDLLGYEWDTSPDNGFRPVGLVDFSSTTVTTSGSFNTEFGNIDTSGTATHNLVEYRDPTSGALVFGAGTVFWSWGLSDQIFGTSWGGSTPDPNVQQATVNLFADMGVQPTTLQASLKIASASTDHTAPTSTISNVSTTAPLEGQSVTVTGTATDTGGGVIAGVDVSTDGGKTWHPATGPVGAATENWSYTFNAPAPGTFSIESRAVDDSINVGTPSPGVSYTVGASTALSIFGSSATPATADVADPNGVEVGFKFTSSSNGQITGIRFYKGPTNTGAHIVDLWSSTGTLLATATATNETASGWQQVNFTSPVKITAGTTYVASYHMTNGGYSDTPYYFDTLQGPTNGSLSAIASGANGLFAYSSGSVFPNNVPSTGDNYWVDVVFNDTSQGPQAANESFATTENTALSISASTLLAADTDPKGLPLSISSVSNPVNGTVSYNPSSQTVTFTPNAGYAGPAGFTYTITDGQSTASGNVSVAVNFPVNEQSLFTAGNAPAVEANDPNSVELGVKFQASASGLITGIRFYKSPLDTGTHVADLWSSTGTLLATATFTGESGSGWQQVNFSKPVVVLGGTTYVASYHTSGNYSYTANYFANPYTNGELTAPTNAGEFSYGTGSIFPTSSVATNYFVDVVFDGSALQPPVANNDSGFDVTRNTPLSIAASALLANDTDPYGLPLSIASVGNATNGTVAYNASTQTVTFTPNSGYLGSASFTYTVGDGTGDTASASVSLAVTPPPPVANNVSGLVATENTALAIAASTLLANDTDPNGLPLSIASVSNATNGTVSYDPNSRTVTYTPTAGYTGPASFTYTITDGQATASANASVAVNYPVTAESVFNTGATPAVVTVNDQSSVELGMKFQTSTSGTITGVRFYKGPQNTGTHVADLWSATGALLATATFSNETASGWQQVNFATPVGVVAGQTYIVSYHTSGNYSASSNFFATADSNGNLTAPSSATSGGNGLYAYGNGSLFPANSFNSTNYWVDVVFNGSSVTPPVANADSVSGAENNTLSIPASTLLANDTDPSGLPLSITSVSNPTNGTVSYNSSTQTVSFVPTTGFVGAAGFTYTLTDGAGNFASANVAVAINAASNPTVHSVNDLVATENTTLSISAASLLANDTDPGGFALSITGVSNATNGTVSYDANAQTVNFVPTNGYTGTASFSFSVGDGHGGTASASASLIVNDPTTSSLFNPATAPSIAAANDPNAIEVGVKFTANESGNITGLRFFKGPGNTGTHVADLWSSTGTLLATANFTNETAGGWQQVNFSSPVAIAAGTTYVASYHTNSGDYAADPNLFATALTNGPLTAPSSSSSSGNGVYAYGSSSLFPTNSFNSTSYGVDVVFKPQLAA